MSLTLGIDPGSRITGYGVVEHHGSEIVYVGSGVVKVGANRSRPERLIRIKRGIDDVVRLYGPEFMAVEEIFMAKNPKSTLTLGEARGVVILSAAEAGIPVYEYSAREVKRSVVGMGAAHKSQVAMMVGKLLKLNHEPETQDETDALAVAYCHAVRVSGAVGELI